MSSDVAQASISGEARVDGGWTFRSGTLDRMIFNGVVSFNEYELPARFAPGDIVIDVGAHIGSFAYAVALRGGEHVYSIEPDRDNCTCAAENLRPYIDKGHVRLMRSAVWRSDPNDDQLRFDGYHAFPRSVRGHGRHRQYRKRLGHLGDGRAGPQDRPR